MAFPWWLQQGLRVPLVPECWGKVVVLAHLVRRRLPEGLPVLFLITSKILNLLSREGHCALPYYILSTRDSHVKG